MTDFTLMKDLMKCIIWLIFLACVANMRGVSQEKTDHTYSLAVHGGAGNMTKENLPAEMQQMFQDSLQKALAIGESILSQGGTSLDAVEACIRFLEDCPLFNAGRGAVYNYDGVIELDASIMDGSTGKAGSVAGISTVRHPISAARRVMEQTPHVMLTGRGAEQFAREQSLEMVDPTFFSTPSRWNEYQKAKARRDSIEKEGKHGTVGCVAMDIYGNLAAGTSTGGMMLKKWGRVGDSPIIGAGTYADNETCAVSATGHGEYFIRNVVAYDISALMKYKGLSLEVAADHVINDKLREQGGKGGVISIDKNGNLAMPFNTSGMYRGWILVDEKNRDSGTAIF